MDDETLKQQLKEIGATFHDDRSYDDQRKIRNSRFDYKPWCIIQCENQETVAKVVKLCKDHQKPIRIRSGGHQHEGMCSANDVVVIDLSQMNKIGHPDARGMASIGPGARLGKVYEELERQEYTLPGGGCYTVNVGGLVQGGGWGMLARDSGLTCDSLQAVELVKADGSIVTLTTSDEPEEHGKNLLWAIKGGGGGNFGVITEYKFRLKSLKGDSKIYAYLVKISYQSDGTDRQLFKELVTCYLEELEHFRSNITSFARVQSEHQVQVQQALKKQKHSFSMTFKCLGSNSEAYEQVKAFHQKLCRIIQKAEGDPRKLKCAVSEDLKISHAHALLNGVIPSELLSSSPPLTLKCEDYTDSQSLPENLALSSQPSWSIFALQPLTKLASPEFKLSNLGASASEAQELKKGLTTCGDSDHPHGVYLPHKVSSAFPKGDFKDMAGHVVDFIFDNQDFPEAETYLSIHSLGGRVRDSESLREQSSFFYRDKEFMLQFQAWWRKVEDPKAAEYMDWIKNFRQHLNDKGCIEGAFINFPDRDLADQRIELLEHYYGGNLDQLRKLKGKHDPDNFFSFRMSIPPL